MSCFRKKNDPKIPSGAAGPTTNNGTPATSRKGCFPCRKKEKKPKQKKEKPPKQGCCGCLPCCRKRNARKSQRNAAVTKVIDQALCVKVLDGNNLVARYEPKGPELSKTTWDQVNQLKVAATTFDKKTGERLQKELLKTANVQFDEQKNMIYIELKIKLRGVDAPEISQAYGTQARDYVAQRCENQLVTLRLYGKDQLNRSIADVIAGASSNQTSINQQLVENGFAWHDVALDGQEVLAQAEKAARQERRGLWMDDKPTPPWEYRKKYPAKK